MTIPIEGYALIGNTRTAALVGRDGSIDWLCAPRFDSRACFAALLGTREHGRWLLAPAAKARKVRRRYRSDTLVLETEFETGDGVVRLIDCMPPWPDRTDVVRVVEGVRGRVPMRMELIIRGGYGVVVPWVRRVESALLATAGPDSLELRTAVETEGKRFTTNAKFTVGKGQRIPFVISHFPSHQSRPLPIDADAAIAATELEWRRWCTRCTYDGRWADAVKRSLVTLKALTYAPTGGIVAAPTTLAAGAHRRHAQLGLTGFAGRATRRKGYSEKRGTFVQYYGSNSLDASLLLMPLVGFLPPDDPRVRGTVEAIERELTFNGFVIRYPTKRRVDDLPAGEGAFLPCSFWLADNLALQGRNADAEALFEHLLTARNDVGLLSEEYDPRTRHQLGNFPQALSHVALINTARNLSHRGGPSEHRSGGMEHAPPSGSKVPARRRKLAPK